MFPARGLTAWCQMTKYGRETQVRSGLNQAPGVWFLCNAGRGLACFKPGEVK
jgi:hypothetical protein